MRWRLAAFTGMGQRALPRSAPSYRLSAPLRSPSCLTRDFFCSMALCCLTYYLLSLSCLTITGRRTCRAARLSARATAASRGVVAVGSAVGKPALPVLSPPAYHYCWRQACWLKTRRRRTGLLQPALPTCAISSRRLCVLQRPLHGRQVFPLLPPTWLLAARTLVGQHIGSGVTCSVPSLQRRRQTRYVAARKDVPLRTAHAGCLCICCAYHPSLSA